MGAHLGVGVFAFGRWPYTNVGIFVSDDAKIIAFYEEKGMQTLEWKVNLANDIRGGIDNSFVPSRPQRISHSTKRRSTSCSKV